MDRATNAHRHHVTKALVGRIVRAARKDPGSLRRRQEKESQHTALVGFVEALYCGWDERAQGMMTTNRLKNELKARHNLDVSVTTIRLLLKRQLGLSYLKVKALSPQTNSIRSLACRQAYAMRMLGAMLTGRRIINVDESWLATMTHRYRSWAARGRPNAHVLK